MVNTINIDVNDKDNLHNEDLYTFNIILFRNLYLFHPHKDKCHDIGCKFLCMSNKSKLQNFKVHMFNILRDKFDTVLIGLSNRQPHMIHRMYCSHKKCNCFDQRRMFESKKVSESTAKVLLSLESLSFLRLFIVFA